MTGFGEHNAVVLPTHEDAAEEAAAREFVDHEVPRGGAATTIRLRAMTIARHVLYSSDLILEGNDHGELLTMQV
jgi:hypothetical protein